MHKIRILHLYNRKSPQLYRSIRLYQVRVQSRKPNVDLNISNGVKSFTALHFGATANMISQNGQEYKVMVTPTFFTTSVFKYQRASSSSWAANVKPAILEPASLN